MLQIRNAGNGKSEWNISEAHLFIPVINGDLVPNKGDKILTSAVTVNPLEGSDQTILTNALEHSLVVGLHKNLLETSNYKSDLLIIQNSDLKLLQCNTDIKVVHPLSDAEEDKSDILWQNQVLKNTTSGNERAIFVLNYDDIDLQKTNSQINLGSISSGTPLQVIKADKGVLTGETINPEKSITNSLFAVNFNSEIDRTETVCVSLNTEESKTIENLKPMAKKKLFQAEAHSDINNVASYKLGEDFAENVFSASNHLPPNCDSTAVTLFDYSKQETDKKDKITPKKNQFTKDSITERDKCSNVPNDSFWEKNLPLKKKAKMKQTLMPVGTENQKALLKNNVIVPQEHVVVLTRRNTKQKTITSLEKQNLDNSLSESAVNSFNKQKKIKLKNLHNGSSVRKVEEDLGDTDLFEDEAESKKSKSAEFVVTKFNDIYELVECLLKCRMINSTVWQTLTSGLKEIKVDILKEMVVKRKENCAPESSNYSPELKAFALILYFKQPAAFNQLSQMYKNGWPSLKVIKEWKQQVNTQHRRNFINVQSDSKHNKW